VSKEQAPSCLRVLERFSDRLEEASGQINDLLFHHGDFFEDVYIVGSQIPDIRQVGNGLIHSSFGEEPARSLFQEQASDEQKPCRDQLHCEWDEPLLLGCWKSLDHSIVDPEANESAELPTEFVGTNKTSTNSGRRHLRNVYRDLEVVSARWIPLKAMMPIEIDLPP